MRACFSEHLARPALPEYSRVALRPQIHYLSFRLDTIFLRKRATRLVCIYAQHARLIFPISVSQFNSYSQVELSLSSAASYIPAKQHSTTTAAPRLNGHLIFIRTAHIPSFYLALESIYTSWESDVAICICNSKSSSKTIYRQRIEQMSDKRRNQKRAKKKYISSRERIKVDRSRDAADYIRTHW